MAAAGSVAPPAEKCFKPKFPDIPRRAEYGSDATEYFWRTFPVNTVCPGKPSLNGKQLKRWADALGCTDEARLHRVLGYIKDGADIGCRGVAREPSRSSNAASVYQYGPQVTDAIAEWVTKGYAFGLVTVEAVPAGAKVSGIWSGRNPMGRSGSF